MELVTKAKIISKVAARFKGSEHQDIYKALLAEKNLTEVRVTEIIGNDSWTKNNCSICWNDFDRTVRLGEPPDWDSATVNICKECLLKALKMIEK